jgi:hypothetical protein
MLGRGLVGRSARERPWRPVRRRVRAGTLRCLFYRRERERAFEAKERREVGSPAASGYARPASVGVPGGGKIEPWRGTWHDAPRGALPEARLGECAADASASACARSPLPDRPWYGVRRRGGRRRVAALWNAGCGGARDVARSSLSVAV